MKILVTGAAGFLGTHLTHTLANRENTDVLAVDKTEINSLEPCKLEFIKKALEGGRVRYVSMDLSLASGLSKLFSEFRPDMIIHGTALLGIRECRDNPEEARRQNVTSLENVLSSCRGSNVKRVILLSTLSVYDTLPAPFKEDMDLPEPTEEYPRTKQAAERTAVQFASETMIPTTILRISNVYGPCQRRDRVIGAFVHRVLTGQAIDIQGDPDNKRDYIYVDDCVRAILHALEPGSPAGIFNIGGSQPTSLRELIRLLEEITNKPIDVRIGSAQGRVQIHSYADNSLAEDVLGFTPDISVREGLERYVEWSRGQR